MPKQEVKVEEARVMTITGLSHKVRIRFPDDDPKKAEICFSLIHGTADEMWVPVHTVKAALDQFADRYADALTE